jgi:hypothetical protein
MQVEKVVLKVPNAVVVLLNPDLGEKVNHLKLHLQSLEVAASETAVQDVL